MHGARKADVSEREQVSRWDHHYQCVVVGSGHAGSCAALSAIDSGCRRVLMIDKCPKEWVGGNGYFTAGAMRCAHEGLEDLLGVLGNPISEEERKSIDLDMYTKEMFEGDIQRLSDGRSDDGLVKELVDQSRDVVGWLSKRIGVPFVLSTNRQAYEVNGRQKFWGGMALSVNHGGKGLIEAHQKALKDAGVDLWFDTKAIKLMMHNGEICGIEVDQMGSYINIRSPAVVLACGGYEASPDMRAKYLGSGWQQARVRGTPFNTGDGFVLAAAVGAQTTGDWEGCHSTCWDAEAGLNAGERELTNQYTKSGYPLGLMINFRGLRFVDEGEDYRNFTYAKFGKAILAQPGGAAFQLWDAKMLDYLRKEEYGDEIVTKKWAQTLEEMVGELEDWGLENKGQFLSTLRAYNQAVQGNQIQQWNPAIKDGLSTNRKVLRIPKSNWALPVDTAPFMAVKVACGITFTFGGLAIDPKTTGVLAHTGNVIPGLFCAGEMVGGLFYGNYPGGSGLTAGAVFGRKAGVCVGQRVLHS
ncbi:FAD binding domain-containing protein [Crepidotus variabilis]|uniref:FAD binding domain-containing protein n=1 Tax=Crepidotus variabilis TaxID=179855 RepID=A0A9P6EEJ7_9AGAR|nr:FAD binding domain-containing protein [Crepidotus variabilis]